MIYIFKCTRCRKNIELDIPMSEYSEKKDKQVCPDCGEKVKRVLTPIGSPIFNCGGFYCTDNK